MLHKLWFGARERHRFRYETDKSPKKLISWISQKMWISWINFCSFGSNNIHVFLNKYSEVLLIHFGKVLIHQKLFKKMASTKKKQPSKHRWNISISLGNQLPMILPWCGNFPHVPLEMFFYNENKKNIFYHFIWIFTVYRNCNHLNKFGFRSLIQGIV